MKTKALALALLLITTANHANAAYTVKNGRLCSIEQEAIYSVEEHYRLAFVAFNKQDWREAKRHFYIVSVNFPETTYGQDSLYYLGMAYYNMEEYDFSNDALNHYLRCQQSSKFFDDAMKLKFAIAEQFRCGAKKRMMGSKQLPKWQSGREIALEIYQQIAAAMPNSDLAAQSLYSKGCMLWSDCLYRESVETFQTLIKRFPKHETTPEAYLAISRVYLDQSHREPQNPDILAFAQMNAKRFVTDFPGEERLNNVEGDILAIKEVYAGGLYETGQFYEKTSRPASAVIYYQKALLSFPETLFAKKSYCRLKRLSHDHKNLATLTFDPDELLQVK